jgi:hypothetical protein
MKRCSDKIHFYRLTDDIATQRKNEDAHLKRVQTFKKFKTHCGTPPDTNGKS